MCGRCCWFEDDERVEGMGHSLELVLLYHQSRAAMISQHSRIVLHQGILQAMLCIIATILFVMCGVCENECNLAVTDKCLLTN